MELMLDMLRHGEIEGGVRYRGRIDDPLTGEGRARMDAVWTRLCGEVEMIVASPLSRCAEPARAWAEGAGIACEIDARVQELAYGAWEGLTPAEIRARWPDLFERWRRNPAGLRPPGGESPEAMWARLADWWTELRARRQAGEVPERLLLVAHSGTLRLLIAGALGAGLETSRKIDMPYGCWSRIAADAHADWLVFHNRLADG
ncbi:MAG: histidine phosphatase family protein [Mariprofundaceae bacterium]